MARPLAYHCKELKLWSLQAASTVFNFCKAFAGSGDIGDEVSHPCYPKLCGGGGQHITLSDWVQRSTAEFPVKTGLIKLVHNIFSFIFYFNNELKKSKCRESPQKGVTPPQGGNSGHLEYRFKKSYRFFCCPDSVVLIIENVIKIQNLHYIQLLKWNFLVLCLF